MINIYDNLSRDQKNLLIGELGLNPGELDMLKFDIKLDEDNNGDTVYKFVLLGDNPQEIIERIPELTGGGVVLPDYIFDEDDETWYDYEYVSGKDPVENLAIFLKELDNLSKLNKMAVSDRKLLVILKRQIYIGLIGSMETYLSDTFIGLVFSNDTFLERFVTTTPEFAKRKFELREIFTAYRDIEKTARDIMLEVIYHDLAKIRQMYIKTFEMEFPPIKDAFKCVKVRHDLVHRNGKTKDRQFIILTEKSINDALDVVKIFVEDLASNIGNLSDPDDDNDLPF